MVMSRDPQDEQPHITQPLPYIANMLATPSQSQSPEEVPPPVQKITRGHSCILCQQRKVKCDRQKPCSNCIKARVECIPSVPAAPRRRRRKFSEQDVATRLKRYEQLLRKHGIKLEDDDDSLDAIPEANQNQVERALSIGPPAVKSDEGILFTDKDSSRYIEK